MFAYCLWRILRRFVNYPDDCKNWVLKILVFENLDWKFSYFDSSNLVLNRNKCREWFFLFKITIFENFLHFFIWGKHVHCSPSLDDQEKRSVETIACSAIVRLSELVIFGASNLSISIESNVKSFHVMLLKSRFRQFELFIEMSKLRCVDDQGLEFYS